MIRRLTIEGLVLFGTLELELGSGLNVLSGGSGQGKSLILQALSFALGAGSGKTAARLMARGASGLRASLELEESARERIAPLLDAGRRERVLAEGDPLVVTRTIQRSGRGRCTLGEGSLTLAELRALGRAIGELYSQGAGPRLVDPARQRALLDAYAGVRDTADAYAATRERAQALAAEDADLARAELEACDQAATARAERDALAELDPEPNEYQDLNVRLEDLSLRAARAQRQVGASRCLLGDDGVQDTLLEVARTVADLADSPHSPAPRDALSPASRGAPPSHLGAPGPALVAQLDALAALATQLEDLAATVGDVGSQLRETEAVDHRELAQIEARVEAFKRLGRRLRLPPGALADRWQAIQAADPELIAERRSQIGRAFATELRRLDRLGKQLAKAREENAAKLGKAVTRTLRRQLGLPQGRFEVELTPLANGPRPTPRTGGTRPTPRRGGACPRPADANGSRLADHDPDLPSLTATLERRHPSPRGHHDAAFRFAPRKATEPAPLDLASGGELARLFLAVGREVSLHTGGGLLVFDEVDQNVGARLGGAVGDCLRDMGAGRQLLAVTHLAPVAARADRHLVVAQDDGRSTVRAVEDAAREEELALMIRGTLTKAALEQARELIAEARPKKRKRRRRRRTVSAA